MIYARGDKFTIVLDDNDESEDEALSKVPGNKIACTAQLFRHINTFADLGTDGLRYPDHYEDEGDGFFAFKARCGLRAYWWYHTERGVVVISHFAYKKRQKLSKLDKDKMKSNRENYKGTYRHE